MARLLRESEPGILIKMLNLRFVTSSSALIVLTHEFALQTSLRLLLPLVVLPVFAGL